MSRIKEISAPDLSRLLDAEHQFEIIDIRTPAEIERGILPDAKVLPMHLIPLKLQFFTASSKQVVLYCRTGSRSAQACRFLHKQGIYNVISLRGGIVKWTSSGLPLTYETAQAVD